MSWKTFIQPAVVSIIVSAITTCFVAPWAASKFSRKNTKDLEKKKALIDTIGQLIGIMEKINAYLFRFEGYAMSTIRVKGYREPMIDAEFVERFGESVSELTILVSNASLFWKEHEDYFENIGDEKIIKEVNRYLKLVREIRRDVHTGVDDVAGKKKEKVLYPEIPPDIFLFEPSVLLGKLRWRLIDKY
ncbi:hypothetical protein [Levilactobacillus andaensis]|uniref:hypothetical protein n=1 Tax=Levilactobacillus andaensis TaxID=2799570 RepID=UPI001940DD8C|nr:hypothetical protein [Levilactobacillus andaensis]